MALAGVTTVGEFHYLHHGPGGTPYDDPNEMGRALIAAAAEAGIRITLIDSCYLHGGIGEPPEGAQRRFSDGSAEAWAERVGAISARTRLGARRSGDPQHARGRPEAAAVVAGWAAERERPLHAHVSEQPAENEACLEAYGRTPTACSPRRVRSRRASPPCTPRISTRPTCACSAARAPAAASARRPSATSPTGSARCAGSRTPARRSRSAATRTPSSTCSRRRARSSSTSGWRAASAGATALPTLLRAATADGHACLGWPDAGRIEPGARADLVTVSLDGVRLAGAEPEHALEAVVFAASAADVRHVLVDGRELVRDGRHASIDVPRELHEAVRAVIA